MRRVVMGIRNSSRLLLKQIYTLKRADNQIFIFQRSSAGIEI